LRGAGNEHHDAYTARQVGRNESEAMEPREVYRADADRMCSTGKATVGVGYGDCAGESAGVRERGMPGKGRIAELGRSLAVSRE